MTSLENGSVKHPGISSAQKSTAAGFLHEVVREHQAYSTYAEPGPHEAATFAVFEAAIRSRSENLSENELSAQARELLVIRMSHRISSDELVKIICEGCPVKEVVTFSKLADSLARQSETAEQTEKIQLSDAPPYQFKVAANHRSSQFRDWLEDLPKVQRDAVLSKLQRVTTDSVKTLKPIELQAQLYELRIFEGPGLRVYIGRIEGDYVILMGGRKDKQLLDLLKAAAMLRDLRSSKPSRSIVDL